MVSIDVSQRHLDVESIMERWVAAEDEREGEEMEIEEEWDDSASDWDWDAQEEEEDDGGWFRYYLDGDPEHN